MPSVRDYLWWTAPGSPTKYLDLYDDDKMMDTMLYMSVNSSLWAVWAYKTELEKSMFVRNIGFVLTSPYLPAATIGGSIAANVAAEAIVFTKVIPQIQKFESVPWYHKFLWVAGV